MPDDVIQQQEELSLPCPELGQDLPLLPVRMLNEYQYCARLASLEWVQGEWAGSADTVEGGRVHRRIDRSCGELPPAHEVEEDTRIHARSSGRFRGFPTTGSGEPDWQ